MLKNWERSPGPWALSTGQHGFARETFEGPSQLLPEMPIFGWLRFYETLPGALQRDRHHGYEIFYMRRGQVKWWVGAEEHDFCAGNVFIVKPGEWHGGEHGAIQPCEHYWLRVKFPDAPGALPGMSRAATHELRDGFDTLRFRNFAASSDVEAFFKRLLQEHRHRDAPNAALAARSLLNILLLTILRDHDRHAAAARQPAIVSWAVRKTVEWLERNRNEQDVDKAALAAAVKLSPSALNARFKKETGRTLHEYVLRLRIEDARQRLTETTEDITTIAHSLFFSSAQYFASVFRKHIGLSPTEYRDEHQANDAGR